MDDVRYIERSSGEVCTEEIYGRWALSLVYGTSTAARLFAFFFLPLLAHLPFLSQFYGYLQKRAASKRKIAPFIHTFKVDASEFAEPISAFRSFNDFFIRKLKPSSRPIVSGANQAAMPADGRYLVFPDLSKTDGFYIKGQAFDLPAFLQDRQLAATFRRGSMAIVRLCPTDYHRFHFPLAGTPSRARAISGTLYSVNPIALVRRLPILWENKRMVTELQTDVGLVLIVEIGATCVGTIHQTYVPGKAVRKGEEKGYFSFGGSCMALLFEPDRIEFDSDLVHNSSRHLETRGLFGSSLGKLQVVVH